MTETKWVRSSLSHLSARLKEAGKAACPTTVGRLLRNNKYSLKVNVKREAGADHPDRNDQFEYIAAQKQAFLEAGLPVISVDTKKKELVGNFKNAGQTWCLQPERVNLHDFPQDALGRAVPYGIYDLAANRGFVCVGDSADTPAFAVEAIALWWEREGKPRYPEANAVLIMCDAGGSNGCRPRAWKQQVQEQLSDRFGLEVSVCHYPTGCSKWNPIEYRLFAPISLNWSGKPLRSFETVLSCMRATMTQTGLQVSAFLLSKVFATGQSVSNEVMKTLNLHLHAVCPRWNYTFQPRVSAP
jgi:Rhodopirellula transposase DDE domain